ncbi:hypothetical protein F5Y06DRAFT_294905 [Hypoxylon sp. FL0890]|nr:hypothetical protein F5Y06DRAFT_294905 [Hypoxylon sp. FL0890]
MFTRTTRHLAPLRAFAAQRISPAIRTQQLERTWVRFSSSQQGQPQSPPEESINKEFFKTFGRPIAKVFLLAIFTYQLAYYFWVRLEQDEIKSEMRGTHTLYILFPYAGACEVANMGQPQRLSPI